MSLFSRHCLSIESVLPHITDWTIAYAYSSYCTLIRCTPAALFRTGYVLAMPIHQILSRYESGRNRYCMAKTYQCAGEKEAPEFSLKLSLKRIPKRRRQYCLITYFRRSIPQMSVKIPNHPLTRSAAFSSMMNRFTNASAFS